MTNTRTRTRAADVERSERSIRVPRLHQAVGVRTGMAVLALLDATLRELLVVSRVGDNPAHVISTLTLPVGLGVLVGLYLARSPEHAPGELVAVGVLVALFLLVTHAPFGRYSSVWNR